MIGCHKLAAIFAALVTAKQNVAPKGLRNLDRTLVLLAFAAYLDGANQTEIVTCQIIATDFLI